ncbi:hypothetical protein GCM10028774_37460 [Spirosoma jeollabukense]
MGLVVLLFIGSAPLSQAQTIRYVTQSGNGSQTGESWANAFSGSQLQAVINGAPAGGQVWVARGTYKPTTGLDRSVNFSMKEGVAIYGGFRGTETSLSQRPDVNPITGQPSSTTLSGDLGTPGDKADNSYHIIISDNVSASSILDGFVLAGGNAPTRASDRAYLGGGGGGMLITGGVPQITNCAFVNNACQDDAIGGALLIRGDEIEFGAVAQPRLTNCLFENNVALRGGAVANANQTTGSSKAFFINCIFDGNVANRGGAMYNDGAGGVADPQLINCSLLNNSAIEFAGYEFAVVGPSGGAMYNSGGFSPSRPVLTNCSLLNNSAANRGGAIFTAEYTMTLINCVLWGNGGSNTIGYFFTASNVVATNCLFESSETDYVGTNCLTTDTSPFAGTTTTMLAATSPAINTGLNSASALVGITTDLVGNPRVNNCIVDMGAYEFQSTASITRQPVSSSTVCTGTSVVVSVATTGQVSAYQWYRDGTVITNQTSATLTLPSTTTANMGRYNVVVTAGCSSLTSTAFSLTVTPSSPDYQPLVDLYNSTNGANWVNKTNWLTGCTPCGWYGVTCTNGRVTGLNLINNNLVGTLPASLSVLTTLQSLELGANALTGGIPTGISNLTALQTLNLSRTQLGGTIPASLGQLTQLQNLLLNESALTGTLPASLGSLSQLQNLQLYTNQLSGCFPGSYTALCGRAQISFTGNPNLPGGGDFGAFCSNGTGSELVISQAPSSATACVGSPFSFSFVAQGAASYQWYKDGQRLAESGPVLSFSSVSGADAGTYQVYINYACRPGAVQSDYFTLTVRSDGACPVSDLVPLLYVSPGLVYGPSSVSVIVSVVNVGALATNGPINLRISRDPMLQLSLPASATTVGSRTVQNAQWSLDSSDPDVYVLRTSQVIGSGSQLSVGLVGSLVVGNTRGQLSVSAVVEGGSGGEVRITNNVDAEKMDYFNK